MISHLFMVEASRVPKVTDNFLKCLEQDSTTDGVERKNINGVVG